MSATNTLKMRFNTTDNKVVTLSLKAPKDSITTSQIEAVADDITTKNIIMTDTDVYAVSLKDAYTTETLTTYYKKAD